MHLLTLICISPLSLSHKHITTTLITRTPVRRIKVDKGFIKSGHVMAPIESGMSVDGHGHQINHDEKRGMNTVEEVHCDQDRNWNTEAGAEPSLP